MKVMTRILLCTRCMLIVFLILTVFNGEDATLTFYVNVNDTGVSFNVMDVNVFNSNLPI